MKFFSKINQWFGNVGTYRMTTDEVSCKKTALIVEVLALIRWHTIKRFIHEEEEYAQL